MLFTKFILSQLWVPFFNAIQFVVGVSSVFVVIVLIYNSKIDHFKKI